MIIIITRRMLTMFRDYLLTISIKNRTTGKCLSNRIYFGDLHLAIRTFYLNYVINPVNTKDLNNIYTTLIEHCINVIQMFCAHWEGYHGYVNVQFQTMKCHIAHYVVDYIWLRLSFLFTFHVTWWQLLYCDDLMHRQINVGLPAYLKCCFRIACRTIIQVKQLPESDTWGRCLTNPLSSLLILIWFVRHISKHVTETSVPKNF